MSSTRRTRDLLQVLSDHEAEVRRLKAALARVLPVSGGTVTGDLGVTGDLSVTGTTIMTGGLTVPSLEVEGNTGGLLRLRDPDATFPDPIDTWIGFYGSDDQRLGWIGSSTGNNKLEIRTESAAEGISLHAAVGDIEMYGDVFITNNESSYGRLELVGPSGAYIDFKNDAAEDYDARLISTGGMLTAFPDFTSGKFYAEVGSTTVPTYTFTGDTDTGFTRSGTNQVSVITGGTESFRVDSSGNMVGNSMAIVGLSYIRTANGSAAAPAYQFTNDTDTGVYLASTGVLGFSSAGTLGFAQNNNSLYANSNSGSLSTSTPRIVINHSANYCIISRSSSAGLYIMRQDSDGRVAEFYRTTSLVGSIAVTTTGTNFNETSDYRVKENVSDLTGSMDILRRVRPVWFTWIEHPEEGTSAGFIAHELAEVFPRAVTGEKDAVDEDGNINPQGVDASKLVPLLVAAVKEQDERIAALEAALSA